jgi:hypothetical protein
MTPRNPQWSIVWNLSELDEGVGCLESPEVVLRSEAEAEVERPLEALREITRLLGPLPGKGPLTAEQNKKITIAYGWAASTLEEILPHERERLSS